MRARVIAMGSSLSEFRRPPHVAPEELPVLRRLRARLAPGATTISEVSGRASAPRPALLLRASVERDVLLALREVLKLANGGGDFPELSLC